MFPAYRSGKSTTAGRATWRAIDILQAFPPGIAPTRGEADAEDSNDRVIAGTRTIFLSENNGVPFPENELAREHYHKKKFAQSKPRQIVSPSEICGLPSISVCFLSACLDCSDFCCWRDPEAAQSKSNTLFTPHPPLLHNQPWHPLRIPRQIAPFAQFHLQHQQKDRRADLHKPGFRARRQASFRGFC